MKCEEINNIKVFKLIINLEINIKPPVFIYLELGVVVRII